MIVCVHSIPVVEEVLGKLLKVGSNLLGLGVVVKFLKEDLAFVKESLCIRLVPDIEEGPAVVDEGLNISINEL